MKLDYKNPILRKQSAPTGHLARYWRLHSAALSLCIIAAAFLLTETHESAASISTAKQLELLTPHSPANTTPLSTLPAIKTTQTIPLSLPAQTIENTLTDTPTDTLDTASPDTLPIVLALSTIPEIKWQTFTVKAGHSFGTIAEKAGVAASEIHALMQMGGDAQALKKLFPGDEIRIKIQPDGKLLALEYDLDRTRYIRVTRQVNDSAEFDIETSTRPQETRTSHASGTIVHSLFIAGIKAGLSTALTIKLASIFEWDIDFGLEVRPGDHFNVIYEETYIEGEKTGEGEIVAAEFTNHGKTHRAIRYTTPEGKTDYYAPDGSSIRKTFMRNPVDFTRISSGFNLNRKHPVLNRIRAHKGVDYAAPSGTPIKSSGDGRVVFRGKKGGYGNTVIIQHGQSYSTLYAHMSRFAANIHDGMRVRQGQIVGFVGRTGLATGSHLHYEFRVNGIHRNPLTVRYPGVQPLPAKYKDDFFGKSKPLLAQFDNLSKLKVAINR